MTTRQLILASYDSNIQAATNEKLRNFYRRERAGYLKRAREREERDKSKRKAGPNWDRLIENETL